MNSNTFLYIIGLTMDIVKATCKCKHNSEKELVVAIREKPLERWGCLAWLFNLFLLFVTWGGWFPFIAGWVLGKYFLMPAYRCQFCNTKLSREQFR